MNDLERLKYVLLNVGSGDDDGLMIKLRNGGAVDSGVTRQMNETKKILKELKKLWSGSDCIPKEACGIFADFYVGIESCLYWYGKQDTEIILSFADEAMELIRECCTPPGNSGRT